jgi:Na+/H+ antiporter NhaD/arsenite permease-like protein
MIVAQVLAVIIFIAMFVLVVMEKIERQYITLGCGGVMIVLVFGIVMRSVDAIWKTLNLSSFFTVDFWYTASESAESSMGINWSTIVFILGMMIMVEGMAKAGFFRWLCLALAKLVHYRTIPIFVTFMILSSVLAMFIDSITVILFLAAVTVELAKLLKFNPIPMILSEIFCANLGGSATMCGDPPNIIIGTSLGYSFADFLVNTGLIAGIGLVAVIFYFFFAYRKELAASSAGGVDLSTIPSPTSAISSKRDFTFSCVIFAAAVILLATHSATGLTVALIGVVIAVVTLGVFWRDALELLKKVDYKTLLFFVGLFIVVGGLEQTQVLEVLAGFIGQISGGNLKLMVAIIIWLSAIASAFVDNIPFAATMIPVVKTLAAAQGVDLSTLAWGLAMGTDIGGSATPIGASANVVGTSVASRNGFFIDWKTYCKTAVPATIIVITISMVIIFVRYC